jgi:hypothetical protein
MAASTRHAGEPRYTGNYITRRTVVLPGSKGTISGTAINDWLDENGDPIYGRDQTDAPVESTRC